jgi:hypothetical protein
MATSPLKSSVMRKISDKELQSVSSLGPFDRYRHFIKRIADFGELWLLQNDRGDYALSQIEDKVVLSVWSAPEYIQSCENAGWEGYAPTVINIDDLNDTLAPLIIKKGYLIDVFPVNNKSGFVVTLDEFIHDLNTELSNYE